MMTSWEDIRETHSSFLKELEKTIPGYSYSDNSHAAATNQKIGEYLVKSLRDSKAKLFDIVQFLYEIQAESVSSMFERYRYDLDHLSDRIKVRHFEWKELPESLLDKLLDLDKKLLEGVKWVALSVQKIHNISVGFTRTGRKDKKRFNLQAAGKASDDLEKQIREITVTFEKRSALLEIGETDLDAEFKRISAEIEKKF